MQFHVEQRPGVENLSQGPPSDTELPTETNARRRFERRYFTVFKTADSLVHAVRPCQARITIAIEMDGIFHTYNSTSADWPPDVRSLVGL